MLSDLTQYSFSVAGKIELADPGAKLTILWVRLLQ